MLVTGVTRYIGSALAGLLADQPGVDRVIGVDAALPEPAERSRMGAAEFVRADIRNPLIARVLVAAAIDTVVHASASASPVTAAARSMAKEMNVLGTMQLLAACQQSMAVQRLLVRSTAAVYGDSARDPAVADEGLQTSSLPFGGAARDAVDIEGYVRSFARRRPDVRVAVPRFAQIVGPTVRNPLTNHFSLSPFVPVLAGRDARLQLIHEADVVAVLRRLVLGDFAGTVNVAGSGMLTVTQAVHRAGRLPLPIPRSALDIAGRLSALSPLGAFSPAAVRLLAEGRVLDTRKLHTEVGFTPVFSTPEAFDDFARTLRPFLDPDAVRSAERRLGGLLGLRPPLAADGPSGATVVDRADRAVRGGGSPANQAGGNAAAGTATAKTSTARTGTARTATGRNVAGGAERPRLVGIDGSAGGRPKVRRRSGSPPGPAGGRPR